MSVDQICISKSGIDCKTERLGKLGVAKPLEGKYADFAPPHRGKRGQGSITSWGAHDDLAQLGHYISEDVATDAMSCTATREILQAFAGELMTYAYANEPDGFQRAVADFKDARARISEKHSSA